MSRKWCGEFLWILPFLLVGLGLLIPSGIIAWNYHNIITAWPTTQAKVSNSRVTVTAPGTYSAEISFNYRVNGREYSVTTGPGYSTSLLSAMRDTIAQYAPGSRHVIRYHPHRPEAIHHNAAYTFSFFMLPLILGSLGLVFFLIGMGALFLTSRGARRDASELPLQEKFQQAKARRRLRRADHMPQMIGGFFAVLGAIAMAVAVWIGYGEYSAPRNWQTVEAHIESNRVIRYSTKTNSRTSSGVPRYALEVEFAYQVDGRDYRTPTTAASGARSPKEVERLAQSEYAPGTLHLIRYNPQSPGYIRFLESNASLAWILGIVGAGVLVMGLSVMIFLSPRSLVKRMVCIL